MLALIKNKKTVFDGYKELSKGGYTIPYKYISSFIDALFLAERDGRKGVSNPYKKHLRILYVSSDDIEMYWTLCIAIGIENELSLWFSSWDESSKIYHYEPDPISIYDYIINCLDLPVTHDPYKEPFIWYTCIIWYKYLWNNDS